MNIKSFTKIGLIGLLIFSFNCYAQDAPLQKSKSEFWKKVSFGGGLGLSFGNNNTQVTIAPSALYQPNEYIAFGPGLNFNYQKFGDFETTLYGISGIVLGNPIPEIQVSAEVEQLRVNQNFDTLSGQEISDDFWNTAIFLGAGYRVGGVTIGARYNVLFDDNDGVYAEAWQPFVRVYF